jgi:hypothetical protein
MVQIQGFDWLLKFSAQIFKQESKWPQMAQADLQNVNITHFFVNIVLI